MESCLEKYSKWYPLDTEYPLWLVRIPILADLYFFIKFSSFMMKSECKYGIAQIKKDSSITKKGMFSFNQLYFYGNSYKDCALKVFDKFSF